MSNPETIAAVARITQEMCGHTASIQNRVIEGLERRIAELEHERDEALDRLELIRGRMLWLMGLVDTEEVE